MKQYLNKRRSLGIIFMLLSIVLAIMIQFGNLSEVKKEFIKVLTLISGILTLWFIFIPKEGIKDILSLLIRKVLGFVKNVAEKIFGASAMKSHKFAHSIYGYSDTSVKITKDKKRKPRSFTHKRFSEMSNREKIRYFYGARMLKAIKKGFLFNNSETPNEIKERLIDEKYIENSEKELIDSYNLARYNDNFKVSEEMVLKMQKYVKIKHKDVQKK